MPSHLELLSGFVLLSRFVVFIEAKKFLTCATRTQAFKFTVQELDFRAATPLGAAHASVSSLKSTDSRMASSVNHSSLEGPPQLLPRCHGQEAGSLYQVICCCLIWCLRYRERWRVREWGRIQSPWCPRLRVGITAKIFNLSRDQVRRPFNRRRSEYLWISIITKLSLQDRPLWSEKTYSRRNLRVFLAVLFLVVITGLNYYQRCSARRTYLPPLSPVLHLVSTSDSSRGLDDPQEFATRIIP